MKNLIIFINLLLLLTGCTWLKIVTSKEKVKPKSEVWQETPSATTNKIRVSTNFTEEDIKTYYLQRVLKLGFKIDEGRTRNNYLSTQLKRQENFYVKLSLKFIGDTVLLSGYYGNRGIGSYYNEMGSSSATINVINDSDIAWEEIKGSSRGWDVLFLASQISEYSNPLVKFKIEFNKEGT